MKTPNWVVVHVHPETDYKLHLIFADGKKKVYDARPLLEKPIYEKLKNVNFFSGPKLNTGQLYGMMRLILLRNTYMNAASLLKI